ncbi:MAG: hypothetical protein E7588_10220 [Ruminococcaceae bacterium]|nr:hypothetical protein [Oscillospiraceae bacterium]
MKKILLLLLAVLCISVFTSCGDMTDDVAAWFSAPTVSTIDYELSGVSGSAVFTYYGENNNKILFTSGEGLEGVQFSFSGDTVTASRPDDGLEWQVTPEMAETLAVFGKLYSYAATLTYTATPSNTQGVAEQKQVSETFEYIDGAFDITFNRADGKPVKLCYTHDGQSLVINIREIEIITQEVE